MALFTIVCVRSFISPSDKDVTESEDFRISGRFEITLSYTRCFVPSVTSTEFVKDDESDGEYEE